MEGNGGIHLHRLVLSLSEALDWVNADSPDARLRATYVAVRIAQAMGLTGKPLQDLFLAAALQGDVLDRLNRRLEALDPEAAGGGSGDVVAGSAARAIRHAGAAAGAPITAHVLVVAAAVSRLIDRNLPVLAQAESICRQVSSGSTVRYNADCVDAFVQMGQTEAFWLDCVSARLHGLIASRLDWPAVEVSHPVVEQIAGAFGEMADSLSPWTAHHSEGVAATAVQLARLTGLARDVDPAMHLAGLLHDLGKLSVPAHVLDKADRLSRQEWAIVRGHPYYTFQILHSAGVPREIIEWAGFHHERIDGRGYPFGLAGPALSVGARIMAVADTYVAMMQDRPHRAGMSQAAAVHLLDCMVANRSMDGDVVAALGRNRERIEHHRRAAQVEPAQTGCSS